MLAIKKVHSLKSTFEGSHLSHASCRSQTPASKTRQDPAKRGPPHSSISSRIANLPAGTNIRLHLPTIFFSLFFAIEPLPDHLVLQRAHDSQNGHLESRMASLRSVCQISALRQTIDHDALLLQHTGPRRRPRFDECESTAAEEHTLRLRDDSRVGEGGSCCWCLYQCCRLIR